MHLKGLVSLTVTANIAFVREHEPILVIQEVPLTNLLKLLKLADMVFLVEKTQYVFLTALSVIYLSLRQNEYRHSLTIMSLRVPGAKQCVNSAMPFLFILPTSLAILLLKQ